MPGSNRATRQLSTHNCQESRWTTSRHHRCIQESHKQSAAQGPSRNSLGRRNTAQSQQGVIRRGDSRKQRTKCVKQANHQTHNKASATTSNSRRRQMYNQQATTGSERDTSGNGFTSNRAQHYTCQNAQQTDRTSTTYSQHDASTGLCCRLSSALLLLESVLLVL